MKKTCVSTLAIFLVTFSALTCQNSRKDLERPERIVSLRQVMYDSATYAKLAQLWKDYYDAYPSEEAYGNWMYAGRYADLPGYESMLKKGVDKYPSNPTLLYLSGCKGSRWQDDLESIQLLERSAALDPSYMDPWFGLAVAYLSRGDREKADVALRRLLDGGAVQDEVMDFSYNMIAGLDSNAILITNGDNDTYPGWILTRIVKFRPDVRIVNRSLLNVDSYTSSVLKEDVPPFITKAELDSLTKQVASEMDQVRAGKLHWSDVPLLGDRLIVRIVEASQRTDRPVYFACTLETSPVLKQYAARGRRLGLATLVTSTPKPYEVQCRELLSRWVRDFRTSGLDRWRLRYEKENGSGRVLMRNYATALYNLRAPIAAAKTDLQLSLFRWYRDHLLGVLPREVMDGTNQIWCSKNAPEEIRAWCKTQGISQ